MDVTNGATGIATGMTATKLAMTVMIGVDFERAPGTQIIHAKRRRAAPHDLRKGKPKEIGKKHSDTWTYPLAAAATKVSRYP